VVNGWRRSSYCNGGACIEVRQNAHFPGRLWIRHQAGGTPTASELSVTRAEFAAFIKACRAGEFDDLTEGSP
jgi:hypothetical protein